jgi:hypothetical protein
LTFNRKHFISLHKENASHCGIVACTRDTDQRALALRIHNEIATAGGSLENKLLRVCRPGR